MVTNLLCPQILNVSELVVDGEVHDTAFFRDEMTGFDCSPVLMKVFFLP